MLPPILPSPTNPICMSNCSLMRRCRRRRGKAVVAQRLEVAVGLGADQRAERERLAGDLEVLGGLVDDLQEAADLRAALVELAGRVQEARAVAPRRGDLVALDQRGAQPGDRGLGLVGVRQVAHDRVVRRRCQTLRQLAQAARFEAGGTLLEHPVGVVLGLLDVGLVERVDLQRPARDGDRELAQEEDPAEVGGAERADVITGWPASLERGQLAPRCSASSSAMCRNTRSSP